MLVLLVTNKPLVSHEVIVESQSLIKSIQPNRKVYKVCRAGQRDAVFALKRASDHNAEVTKGILLILICNFEYVITNQCLNILQLSVLQHDNVIHLLVSAAPRPGETLLFEYCQHVLDGLLRHPPLAWDNADRKCVAQQLCQGVEYIHKHGWIHGSRKPSNVLLNFENEVLAGQDFRLFSYHTGEG